MYSVYKIIEILYIVFSYNVFEIQCVFYSYSVAQLRVAPLQGLICHVRLVLVDWTAQVPRMRLKVGLQNLNLFIFPHLILQCQMLKVIKVCNLPLTRSMSPFSLLYFSLQHDDLTYNSVHSSSRCPKILAAQGQGFSILITALSPVPRKVPGIYLVLDKYLLNK